MPETQHWAPKTRAGAAKPEIPASPVTPKIPVSAIPQTPPVRTSPVPPQPSRPGFFERNPDFEKFIGENLIPKIGIAILVIAIGFFVMYTIDQDWIGPAGRIGIGMLCGGILSRPDAAASEACIKSLLQVLVGLKGLGVGVEVSNNYPADVRYGRSD